MNKREQIQRALGDFVSEENPIGYCPKCRNWHQEPDLVLGILTGENCETISVYREAVIFKCRELYGGGMHWPRVMELWREHYPTLRKPDEKDGAYLNRMMEYAAQADFWPKLQMASEIFIGFVPNPVPASVRWKDTLGPILWEKAQAIKAKYPLAKTIRRSKKLSASVHRKNRGARTSRQTKRVVNV